MSRNTTDEIFRGFLAINAMLRGEAALVRRALKRRDWERKYNPNWANQPRAPRGVPEGGQWVAGGGGGGRHIPRRNPPTKDADVDPHRFPVEVAEGIDEESPSFFDPVDDNPYLWDLSARGLLPENPTVADFYNLRFRLRVLRSPEFSAIARRANMTPAQLVHALDYGSSVMSERAIAAVDALFENPGIAGTNIVAREEALRRYIDLSGVNHEYRERMFAEIIGLAGYTHEEFEQQKLIVGVGLQFPFLFGGGGPRTTPAITPRGSFPTPAPNSVWRLPPVQRGRIIEATRGHNLPRAFRIIDRFDENGVATSIKSIDLNLPTYQRPVALESTLRGEVDRVAGFKGDGYARYIVHEEEITARALEVVIPHAGSAEQQAAIAAAVRYGEFRSVTVHVVIYP